MNPVRLMTELLQLFKTTRAAVRRLYFFLYELQKKVRDSVFFVYFIIFQ